MDLLHRIAAGDQNAVQEFLDRYSGLVWSVVRRFTSDSGDAEDAVQEVFIDLWKNADRFDATKSSEKSFVVMVARRRLIDRLRKQKRRIETDPIGDTFEIGTDDHNRIERGTEARIAAEALDVLGPAQRRVLELAVLRGMSHGDIAAAEGMPLGTVKSHIRRGLQIVRERLGAPTDLGSPS